MAKRLTVDITEQQYKELENFAQRRNVTIAQILGNYVGDLIGIEENGSDERIFARQYFDRTHLSWMYLE
ncbi:hypothetical protein [Sporosarcina beigongshangi]|uniref:hypothetical protein n=1 Tax=Sporosarcina beigongshangi TaxID=2782538 RepID=UPI00193965FA|nr:hypothetical protein [Sporosarcina beigongshangi]